MKKFCLTFLCILSVILGIQISFAEEGVKLGSFENTRQVLLLPTAYSGSGREGADYLTSEMHRIFRYPYYELMDNSAYESGVSPEDLQTVGEASGADIVVLPVVSTWRQYTFYRPFFFDDDPWTVLYVTVDVYSWKQGENGIRDDRVSIRKEDELTLLRVRTVMQELIGRLRKKFPYTRVPGDISSNLSGPVVTKETQGTDKLPY